MAHGSLRGGRHGLRAAPTGPDPACPYALPERQMIVRLVEPARETGTEGVPDLLDPRRWSAPVGRVDSLSARERRVLVLLGIGESNRSIARRLDISERTVKAHITRILATLGVESRLQAGLVACAWARARAAARRPESDPAGTRAA